MLHSTRSVALCAGRLGGRSLSGAVLLGFALLAAACGEASDPSGDPSGGAASTMPVTTSEAPITTSDRPVAASPAATSIPPVATTAVEVASSPASVAPGEVETGPPPGRGLIAFWNGCASEGVHLVDTAGATHGTLKVAGPPTWSPDGDRLAVIDEDRGWLSTVDVATGAVRDLAPVSRPNTDSPLGRAPMAWSPDGAEIAYQPREPEGLHRVMADGTGDQLVQSEPVVAVAWSAGGELLWASTDPPVGVPILPGDLVVFRQAVAGGPIEEVLRTPLPSTYAHAGAFSSQLDGVALALSMDDSFKDWRIVVADLPGGAVHEVTPPGGQINNVVFSPDGAALAFTRFDPPYGYSALVTVNRDRTKDRVLLSADMNFAVAPMWSPDGASIVVGGSDGVIVVDARDATFTKLAKSVRDAPCDIASFQP